MQSNFYAPRPRQTEAGVLYDILNIRKLVDEAADLAVRAQNGTASSALNDVRNGNNGFLGQGGGGGGAKLSSERKYRMRELAAQKLAAAYKLDEIAACVATMQSTSALDNVGSLVLQRNAASTDAKYVHFFHEKIVSRTVAESTSLMPLTEVIAAEPGHAAPYRTRAATRIFKDDHTGAIQDLTEALALCRAQQAIHATGKSQGAMRHSTTDDEQERRTWSREWVEEHRLSDQDRPSGLEMQCLYQRANQYLAIACSGIGPALRQFHVAKQLQTGGREQISEYSGLNADGNKDRNPYQEGLEARERLRKAAKRALRDYTAFLARLDYGWASTCGIDASEVSDGDRTLPHRLMIGDSSSGSSSPSTTLAAKVSNETRNRPFVRHNGHINPTAPRVLAVSDLFSSSLPTTGSAPAQPPLLFNCAVSTLNHNLIPSPSSTVSPSESVTFHPLLKDVLHSLLLAHAILQTAQTTLARHAHNVVRLARLTEGNPFFLTSRSPARTDWVEVLQKAGPSWLRLADSWEALCAPHKSSRPSKTGAGEAQSYNDIETASTRRAGATRAGSKQDDISIALARRERLKMASLDTADIPTNPSSKTNNVHVSSSGASAPTSSAAAASSEDESTTKLQYSTALTYETVTAALLERKGPDGITAKDDEYHIGKARAETIARWVLEAPVVVEKGGAGRRRNRQTVMKCDRNGHDDGAFTSVGSQEQVIANGT